MSVPHIPKIGPGPVWSSRYPSHALMATHELVRLKGPQVGIRVSIGRILWKVARCCLDTLKWLHDTLDALKWLHDTRVSAAVAVAFYTTEVACHVRTVCRFIS
jgi:hypothetical protein